MSLPNNKELVLRANTKWLHLDFQGLLDYRDLIGILVLRDFTARYKQTVLGPIWFFLNPIVTTVAFTLIFNKVIGVPTDGAPPLLFYMSGMLGWNYFSTVLAGTSNALAGNTHLFSKVYFPRLIPPLATTISAGFTLAIQFITFLFFYFQHKFTVPDTVVSSPSFLWLAYLGVVVHMGMLGLGCGLILSAITAKYRDLAQIQAFLINLLMYATPVIYPLSKIPEKFRWLAQLNPMTVIVEATRNIFLGTGSIIATDYLRSLLVSALVLLIGIFTYQRAARTFVDTV